MSDNVNITPGSGVIVAADEIGGVQYQRVKPVFGPDGVATDISHASPLPTESLELRDLLLRMVALLSSPRGYDKSQGRHRGTVAVESGTVTTVTTVTTVSSVSNIAQVGGRDAGQMIISPLSRQSWALNHRSRIS